VQEFTMRSAFAPKSSAESVTFCRRPFMPNLWSKRKGDFSVEAARQTRPRLLGRWAQQRSSECVRLASVGSEEVCDYPMKVSLANPASRGSHCTTRSLFEERECQVWAARSVSQADIRSEHLCTYDLPKRCWCDCTHILNPGRAGTVHRWRRSLRDQTGYSFVANTNSQARRCASTLVDTNAFAPTYMYVGELCVSTLTRVSPAGVALTPPSRTISVAPIFLP
jgi:hypothetical protein